MRTVVPISTPSRQSQESDALSEVRDLLVAREKIANARTALARERQKLNDDAVRALASHLAKTDSLNPDDAVTRYKALTEDRKKLDERELALEALQRSVNEHLENLKKTRRELLESALGERLANLKRAIASQGESQSELSRQLDMFEAELKALQPRRKKTGAPTARSGKTASGTAGSGKKAPSDTNRQ